MTNNQTIMNDLKRENRHAMVVDYLRNKEVARYYNISYFGEDLDDDLPFLKPLTDAQRAELQAIIDRCKAEDLPLREYFCEQGTPKHLVLDEPHFFEEPTSADLETVHYPCAVKVALFFEGLGEAPEIQTCEIILPEERYAELLEWQLSVRHDSYNDLSFHRPELYREIETQVRYALVCYHAQAQTTPAFALELTGIKDDACQLVGEPAVMCEIFTLFRQGYSEHTVLDINERVLRFSHERVAEGKYTAHHLDGIDAIAVEEALGVKRYADIVAALKERFGGPDGVVSLREFLSQQNIKYSEQRVEYDNATLESDNQ